MALAPDPSDKLDAQADGAFGGKPVNRRAGYGDRLAMALRFAKKGACLSAGEGQMIVEHYEDEIVRLRKELQLAVPRIIHDTGEFFVSVDGMRDTITQLLDELAAVKAERDALRDQLTHQTITLTAEHQRAERILSALREPSDRVIVAAYDALCLQDHENAKYSLADTIRAAVTAAEKEVGDA